MERKLSRAQKAYIKTKVVYNNIRDRVDQLEAAFMADHGRSEKHTYGILDDDALFYRLNDEFSEMYHDENAQLVKAVQNLRQAENNLIAYGLSVMPTIYDKYTDTLHSHSNRDITVRQKLIDLAFRLDMRTVSRKRNFN